jgi:DNA-binding transcriptional MerR regulator
MRDETVGVPRCLDMRADGTGLTLSNVTAASDADRPSGGAVVAPVNGEALSPTTGPPAGRSEGRRTEGLSEGLGVGTTVRTKPNATLSVAAVAGRLGVSPTTLRTWDRRHNLGPSHHEPGRHRRYSAEDVARLELMRRLAMDGVGASEAARIALATPPDELPRVDLQGTGTPQPPQHPATVVPMPRAEDKIRGLVRAATALDATSVHQILADSVDRKGVIATWDSLVVPTLTTIGKRWERTGQGVDVEHLASECVLGALRQHVQKFRGAPINARPVLLACAEEEMHSLPLHATDAALAERHIGARVLGARVPRDALASAIRRVQPAAILLWSHRSSTGDPTQLDAIPDLRPAPLVALGGNGWPPGIEHQTRRLRLVVVRDLSEAVQVLSRAAGAA